MVGEQNMSVDSRSEQRAMLANDIRVMVSDLNQKLRQAAQQGLDVQATATQRHEFGPGGVSAPVINVRLLAEIE